MIDYKALCAELVDDLEEWVDGYLISDPPDECTAASFELIDRARAALAVPVPTAEDPSAVQAADGEVAELVGFLRLYSDHVMDKYGFAEQLARAADLLERLAGPQRVPEGPAGREPASVNTEVNDALAEPEPGGPTDKELHQLWQELYSFHDGPTSGDVAEIARAVLARWGQG